MWNSEMYSPVATFHQGNLNIQDSDCSRGSVVYLLDFGVDNIYIGSTTNLQSRLRHHAEQLKTGQHTSYIQKAYNETGHFNAYVLIKLLNANDDELREAEKQYDSFGQTKTKYEHTISVFINGKQQMEKSDNRADNRANCAIKTSIHFIDKYI